MISSLAASPDSLLERDLALAEIPTREELALSLSGFLGVDPVEAVTDESADDVSSAASFVGRDGVQTYGGGLVEAEGEAHVLGHDVEGNTGIDSARQCVTMSYMTTTQQVLAKHLNRAVDLVLCAADTILDIPAASDQPCTHNTVTFEHVEQCCAEGFDCDLCGNLIPWDVMGLTVEEAMDLDLAVLCSACQEVTE